VRPSGSTKSARPNPGTTPRVSAEAEHRYVGDLVVPEGGGDVLLADVPYGEGEGTVLDQPPAGRFPVVLTSSPADYPAAAGRVAEAVTVLFRQPPEPRDLQQVNGSGGLIPGVGMMSLSWGGLEPDAAEPEEPSAYAEGWHEILLDERPAPTRSDSSPASAAQAGRPSPTARAGWSPLCSAWTTRACPVDRVTLGSPARCPGMGRGDLTDAEWEQLRPFLPVSNRRCGRWRDHRAAILFHPRNACLYRRPTISSSIRAVIEVRWEPPPSTWAVTVTTASLSGEIMQSWP